MGILLIAKDNIKKKKGNTFILFLLVTMAVLLLYTSVFVLSNMEKSIDNSNASVNGADYFLLTMSAHTDKIEEILHRQKEIKYLESEKALYIQGCQYYSNLKEKDKTTQLDFYFLDKNEERKLSTLKIIDEGSKWTDNSIILPYHMKAGMGYQSGDPFHITYDGGTYSFKIYGFTEDVLFANPLNIPMGKCFISSKFFNRYSAKWGGRQTVFRGDLRDGCDSEKFEEKLAHTLNDEVPNYKFVISWGLNYVTMKYGAGITVNIFMGILAVFAALLVLISLIIIRFNINNHIEMNIKNIGILRASGYTSRQIELAMVLEFFIISMCGIFAGLFIADCASDAIGGIVSSSVGLCWNVGFDFRSALISITSTLLLIFLTVMASSRKLKKITPLNALRNGIHTHNFKKNCVRLDQVRLPLNSAIGIKTILHNKKRNIMVCLITALLAFCVNISVCLYENFALKNDKLLDIVGIENPDIMVMIKGKDAKNRSGTVEEIKGKIEKRDGINRVLEYASYDILCKKGSIEANVNCDIYDVTDNLRVDNVIEGKKPQYDNEIMLTTVIADKLGAKIGDMVYLEMDGGRKPYLLTGISQGINHMGKKGMITKEGVQRLNANIVPNVLYIYMKDGADIDSKIDDLKAAVPNPNRNIEITNAQNSFSTVLRSVITVMKASCAIMLTVVFLVIAMIILLLIKNQLVRERRQLGIYKALGYTTGQLILQTVMGCIPVIVTGALLGSIIFRLRMNTVFAIALSMFGIEKCDMNFNPGYILAILSGITLWAGMIAIVCSAKVRKIVPWKMMQDV